MVRVVQEVEGRERDGRGLKHCQELLRLGV